MISSITKYLQNALFNNGLAILLTIAGLGIGGAVVKHKYDAWQDKRQAQAQTKAITDRCTQDVIDRNEIEAEARDAITNDPDNSFINQ